MPMRAWNCATVCLHELVSPYSSPPPLRSSSQCRQSTSGFDENANKKHSGVKSFRSAMPILWNRLPDTLQHAGDVFSVAAEITFVYPWSPTGLSSPSLGRHYFPTVPLHPSHHSPPTSLSPQSPYIPLPTVPLHPSPHYPSCTPLPQSCIPLPTVPPAPLSPQSLLHPSPHSPPAPLSPQSLLHPSPHSPSCTPLPTVPPAPLSPQSSCTPLPTVPPAPLSPQSSCTPLPTVLLHPSPHSPSCTPLPTVLLHPSPHSPPTSLSPQSLLHPSPHSPPAPLSPQSLSSQFLPLTVLSPLPFAIIFAKSNEQCGCLYGVTLR